MIAQDFSAYLQKQLKPPQLCVVFHFLRVFKPLGLKYLGKNYFSLILIFTSMAFSLNNCSFLYFYLQKPCTY